jgi:type IV fimbrial biogenesis protein FimT
MSSKQGFVATNRGFTILELVIVMVIVAIGVALAVPAYQNVMQRRETTAQAEDLVAFMSFAQSEAIKYNRLISVHLTYTNKDDWCIGVSEGDSGCNCKVSNACLLNGVEKVLSSTTQTTSSMTDYNGDDLTFVFDPIRGTMISTDLTEEDHFFTLRSDNENWSLTIDVEATGRFRICNPVPATAVPGYPAC